MPSFFKERRAELLITITAFCLCFQFFPLVTDDYSSFIYDCSGGQFSNYPYFPYYWALIGTGSVSKILYAKWPDYNWLGILIVAYAFMSVYLTLRVLKTIILAGISQKYLLRTLQVLFALFSAENIIYLNCTRHALILAGVALINLLFCKKPSKLFYLVNILLFVLGILIRPESGLGMLLLVYTGYLIYRFDLMFLVKRTFFPALAVAIMSLVYFVDWSSTDQFYKKIEPEVEYKLMEHQGIGINAMHTPQDSVKYQVAMAAMIFDTRVLTPQYYRSILVPTSMSFEHISSRFSHVLSFYRYYLFVPCYFLALFFLSIFQPDSKRLLFKITLYQIATFLIIYLADYTGELISGRHFLEIQLIYLLIASFYFFSATVISGFWVQNVSIKYGCLLSVITIGCLFLVISASYITLSNYKKDSDLIANDTHCYENAMERMDSLYTNRVIIVTTDDYHIFDHLFSIKNKNYTRNTYLMYDAWTYYLYPDYLNYLASECHCDPLDPVAFFNWLSTKHALYIAEPWRYDLTSNYMKTVHGQKIKFVINEEYQKPPCVYNTNLKNFELRTVTIEQ